MNQFYGETVNICKEAKEANRHGHNTHRHWAFAEFKQGNMVKAIKKIRKGVTKMPDSSDNWVVWGHILRTAGKYNSAKHKFTRALKIDPQNKTAKSEMHVVENLIYFDQMLPTDATLKMRTRAETDEEGEPSQTSYCALF